jgi:tetratricopeptide (TPR) repeat protein
MRAILAFTIYVSLGFGDDLSWKEIHARGLAALERNDLENASRLFEKSWHLAQTPDQRGVSANDIGVVLHQVGRDRESALWLERSLAIWKSDPAQHSRIALTCEALASAWRADGYYAKAEQLLREPIADPAVLPEERALLLDTLGDILREEGRSRESRAVFEEALRVPGSSWKRVAEARLGLADLNREARRWNESEADWNNAASLANEHHDVLFEAVAWRGLGQTWIDQGSTSRAEPLLRRALAVFETQPVPVRSNQVATTLSAMAMIYLAENKLALAEEALTRAIDGEETALGGGHPQVGILLEILGDTVARRKQMDLARDYFGRAWRIMADTFGEQSMMAGAVLSAWGKIEQRSGDINRAAEQYAKALAILRSGGSDVEDMRLFVMEHYAQTLKATHHKREASVLFAQVKGFRGK